MNYFNRGISVYNAIQRSLFAMLVSFSRVIDIANVNAHRDCCC